MAGPGGFAGGLSLGALGRSGFLAKLKVAEGLGRLWVISKCRVVTPGPSSPAAKEGAQRQPFSIPLQSWLQEELSLPAAVPSEPSLAHGAGSGAQLLLAVSEPAPLPALGADNVCILCAE